MNRIDKTRMLEAKRLTLQAMDLLSRVADRNEGKDLGKEAEFLFEELQDVCQRIENELKG